MARKSEQNLRYQNKLTDPRWEKRPVNYAESVAQGFAMHVSGKNYLLDKVVIVTGDKCETAVELAVKDLSRYFSETCKNVKVWSKRSSEFNWADHKNHHLILVGNEMENEVIKTVKDKLQLRYKVKFRDRYQEITGVKLPDIGAGFSVKTVASPYNETRAVILLEGEDKLGIQYAVYDWAEEVLGIRYYSPYFDYIPKWNCIQAPSLNYVEEANFPLRRLEVWDYAAGDSWDLVKNKIGPSVKHNNDFTKSFGNDAHNDPWQWYQNGLLGDVTMMNRCVDWVVKNKQNVITWTHEHFYHLPPITPLDYAKYEVMRGLKIMGYLSTGSNHIQIGGVLKNLEAHLCQTADGAKLDNHVCYKTKAYWEQLEREILWHERPENKIRQVAAFCLYYGESNCAYAGYCLSDRTKLGCAKCGAIPNWQKWTHTMKIAEKRLKALGWNVPVGIVDFGAGSSGTPLDDYDSRFGVNPEYDRQLVYHAPFKNNFFELRPGGDHTYEEMGHYWDLVKERNRSEKLKLSIFKEGESILMMSTDLPLFSPYYFKTRDHDFKALSGDKVTIGHDTNMYTTTKLEWLKQYHAFSCQWNYKKGWEQFLADELDHLFGQGAGRELVKVFGLLSRVMEQEEIWKNTPYNKDVESYRGIQTNYAYLKYIFLNLTLLPMDLMHMRKRNGGISFIGEPTNTYCRIRDNAQVRDYYQFVMGDYKSVLAEAEHYLNLLALCETSMNGLNEKVKRNKYFYAREFEYYFKGAILFLRWRLKFVLSYCLLLDGFYHMRRLDKEGMWQSLERVLNVSGTAIADLKAYWKEYGLTNEPGWATATPAVEYVERFRSEWMLLYKNIEQTDFHHRGDRFKEYLFGSGSFPEIFTGKMKVVGAPLPCHIETWIQRGRKIIRLDKKIPEVILNKN